MQDEKRVKDIMVPLAEYAVVGEDATLADALAALQEAMGKLAPGRFKHRAVLMRDRTGAIVGKMGHLAFLRGVLCGPQGGKDAALLNRAGAEEEMSQAREDMMSLLSADLIDLRERVRHVRVADVCVPASASIDAEANVIEAILMFQRHDSLSLLVSSNNQTIGILRLSDLFDEIAKRCAPGE